MGDKDTTLWGVHAGRSGEADSLFLKSSLLALGWRRLGDLGNLAPNREAYKAAVAEAYPESKAGAIPVYAGVMYRFVHEMQDGDLVAYPSKIDKRIHLGAVVGPYQYSPDKNDRYPHQRPVKWSMDLPRTQFSQGALYEIGSSVTLFLVSTHDDEFRAALAGEIPDVSTADDATVAIVADEIQQTTRDFILKQLAKELKGHPFAEFVGALLETMGYQAQVSPPGPDTGIDILAHQDELGFVPPIVKVQVKSGEGSVGAPTVQALYGNVESGEYGLLVTLGTFTSQARSFARGKSNLRLVDGEGVVNLVLQHYEDFDSRYKGLLPLKRVYVPEPLDESDE